MLFSIFFKVLNSDISLLFSASTLVKRLFKVVKKILKGKIFFRAHSMVRVNRDGYDKRAG